MRCHSRALNVARQGPSAGAGGDLPVRPAYRGREVEGLDVELLVQHPLVSDIAGLACSVAGAPMGAVCLVDAGEGWHVATSGLDPEHAPLSLASAAVATSDGVLIVGQPGGVDIGDLTSPSLDIRSAVALQIASPGGDVIGCLCVFDTEHRRFTDATVANLAALVRQVERHVDRGVEQHYLRDLSIRLVESERALADTLGRLEMSNRDLEHVAYHVAHELQAPLHAVAAFASVLDNSLETGVDRQLLSTSAAHVQTESLRLSDHVSSLFALAQFSTANVGHEIVPLAPLLGEVVEMFAETVGPIAVRCDPNLRVVGDEAAIRTVLTNLLSNASRYRSPDRDLLVSVEANRVDDVVTIDVSDNGIGIAIHDTERIFDVFQRIDRSGAGAGVGLALCRRIVERLGGSIGVRSVVDVGSTFTVALDVR